MSDWSCYQVVVVRGYSQPDQGRYGVKRVDIDEDDE
jgi:hypothetical protein